ncbi:thiosulfate oxidation carrier complex protein SoxZ [Azohydromonas caseinilytica]|uniref:Thiosulfate oxidation carrier complex protein SoxZ n=1 Tax=Azohydromonas caseinilytica TaxID=2728836 RepID=A0A848FHZ6_9BURK|nr:thiosulfate oxidation carrier complex protein SoxZ [Azohydromonas caseinilytica]NML17471.1 thiosulfate oxidation carrier complex protein SoxZ [Azohydromonas caseinilytica]
MGQPSRMRAVAKDGVVELRLLMSHPMENGLRHDASGALIPLHHIERVDIECGGRPVLQARLGPGVSRDPFLQLRFRGAQGERVLVRWVDNHGDSRSDETTVA